MMLEDIEFWEDVYDSKPLSWDINCAVTARKLELDLFRTCRYPKKVPLDFAGMVVCTIITTKWLHTKKQRQVDIQLSQQVE